VTADRIGMRGEIEAWAREHDLPYFDESVRFPDFRIDYVVDGRERHEDLEVLTGHAEMGVADYVLESISGHLSRRMFEHYSHIRIDAKRQALDALDAQRGCVLPALGGSRHGGNGDGAEIRAVVELPESVTSQFAFAGLAALR